MVYLNYYLNIKNNLMESFVNYICFINKTKVTENYQ